MKRIYLLALFAIGMITSISAQRIALITNQADVNTLVSEKYVYEALVGWGYDVTTVEDDSVGNGAADFTDYDAIVVSEVASSGKLVNLHTLYKFPKPVINLKGFMVRYDKWGWTVNPDPATYTDKNAYPTYMEDRAACANGGKDMKILNADHYITQDFTADQTITWTNAPCGLGKEMFGYGYKLEQVSGAVALTQNLSTNIPSDYGSIYAVPAGATIQGAVDTITTEHNIVIIGAHQFALADDDQLDDPVQQNYMTEDFLKLLQRSVEWAVFGDEGPGASVALITNGAYANKFASDKYVMEALVDLGYKTTVVEDDSVGNEAADFSAFDAIVVGEIASSGKLVNLHTKYQFPKPVVNLKGFMVRYDKWGWTVNPDPATYTDKNAYPTYMEDRAACANGGKDMTILTADHYITQDFSADQSITWSSAPCGLGKEMFGYGYKLDQISDAIMLTKNNSSNIPADYGSIYAIPTGSVIQGAIDTITTENRIVVMGTQHFALGDDDMLDDPPGQNYMTADLLTLFARSMEWALGAADLGVGKRSSFSDVLVYPNPATDQVNLKFNVNGTQEVRLSLYNLVGQRFEVNTPQKYSGASEMSIETSGLTTGIYLYVLQIGNEVHQGKLNIVK